MANPTGRKVVLVTGASAGIGAAVAREAARQGHDLALTARRRDRLDAVATECRGVGSDVLVIAADLGDPETPERLVTQTVERFGRLEVLVNNAGFGLPTFFGEAEPDAIRRQLDVNFVAPLLLRHAIPHLVNRRGTILNIGSSITSMANPALGAYGATKAGLAYWTNALRRELRLKGVTVCLVEPGPIRTDFFSAIATHTDHEGYHPLLDAPYGWMSGDVEDAARRIVRLIEKPRRRLSVPRRVVIPWRAFGWLLDTFPALGDAGIAIMIRHFERQAERRKGVVEPVEAGSR